MQKKVIELNLEYGNPCVEKAMNNMTNSLTTLKRQGYKAVIIIHGYGSSGVGGGIKIATQKALATNGLCGIVRTFVSGENWMIEKKRILSICKSLDAYEHRIADNSGVTVVVLR